MHAPECLRDEVKECGLSGWCRDADPLSVAISSDDELEDSEAHDCARSLGSFEVDHPKLELYC